MRNIEPRLAMYPTVCPLCGERVDRGELLVGVKRGSTECSGCMTCFWDAQEPQEEVS